MNRMDFDPLEFSNKLIDWYRDVRRDLPWRVAQGRPDPYHVLVSETMLQQTQVNTVIGYFGRFIRQFPTLQALAQADEQQVLRAWQGLGYYRRARNLHAAAQTIVQKYGGEVPKDVATLLKLPGIGRYTAGAVASLAFGVPAPIVDGNILRVLCRIDAIRSDPRSTQVQKRLWTRAAQLLPGDQPGDFNSGMMELGATVCLPRHPRCQDCPVRMFCKAKVLGLQEQIPSPRTTRTLPVVQRTVYCIKRQDGRYLIEQRPPAGRWAGMWQFITIDPEANDSLPPVIRITQLVRFHHTLSHRRYEFTVFTGGCKPGWSVGTGRTWVNLKELETYPLAGPHARIAALLRA